MAAIFTRFKKKPSTEEILVKLEKDINRTLEYKRTTEQTRKHLIGSLILYSVFLYVIVAVVFYFWYFPNTLLDGLVHSLPLFIFPLLKVRKKFLLLVEKDHISRDGVAS
ncbi:protein lunapark-like [Limulus polyphemus]|uniref:Protein lunapark-like n=1 Tax=Limulus polyphemus TaxID=6850 RepID=A0ABM1TPG0_LIMPO|nr:protein lunapark-like [Limulus polyphemus]XP_022257767.1 protein lunapark-like [Limulus polyphemus]XP_022257769.1 protein lunapark-like [Limulus polyphemus]